MSCALSCGILVYGHRPFDLCLRAPSLMPTGFRFYTKGPCPFYWSLLTVLNYLAHDTLSLSILSIQLIIWNIQIRYHSTLSWVKSWVCIKATKIHKIRTWFASKNVFCLTHVFWNTNLCYQKDSRVYSKSNKKFVTPFAMIFWLFWSNINHISWFWCLEEMPWRGYIIEKQVLQVEWFSKAFHGQK